MNEDLFRLDLTGIESGKMRTDDRRLAVGVLESVDQHTNYRRFLCRDKADSLSSYRGNDWHLADSHSSLD